MAIEEDSVANGIGEGLLVGVRIDEILLLGMAEESTFEKNGWVVNASENAKAGAANATVFDVHFESRIVQALQAGPVNGSGESDVSGVLPVPRTLDEVRIFEGSAVVRDSFRR